ncbi:hypothetical protein, partial [Bacillus sp. BML-BC060]|uniref:hypothetical protein n=1 Tax=Bacillus sp. BML-BC060 TaxID=2842487 RepID=UPI001C7F62A5
MQYDHDQLRGYGHLYWGAEGIIQFLYEVALLFADTKIGKFEDIHDEEIGCKCRYETILDFP